MGDGLERLIVLGTRRFEAPVNGELRAVADVLCADLNNKQLVHKHEPQDFRWLSFSHGIAEKYVPDVQLALLECCIRHTIRQEGSRTHFIAKIDTQEQRDALPKGVFIHRTPKIHAPQTIGLDWNGIDRAETIIASLGYHRTLDPFDPDPRAYRIVNTEHGNRLRMNPMRKADFNRFAIQTREFTSEKTWQLWVDRARIPNEHDAELLGQYLREHLDPAYASVFVSRSVTRIPKRHIEYIVGVRSPQPNLSALQAITVHREDGTIFRPFFRPGEHPEARKEYEDPAGLDSQRDILDWLYPPMRHFGTQALPTKREFQQTMDLLANEMLVFDCEFGDYDENNPEKGYLASSQFGQRGKAWLHVPKALTGGLGTILGAPIIAHETPFAEVRATLEDLARGDVVVGVNIRDFDVHKMRGRAKHTFTRLMRSTLAISGTEATESEQAEFSAKAQDARALRALPKQSLSFDHLAILDLMHYGRRHRTFRGGNSVEAMAFTRKLIDYDEQQQLFRQAIAGNPRAARRALRYAVTDIPLEAGTAESFIPSIGVEMLLSEVGVFRVCYGRHDRLARTVHTHAAYNRGTHFDSGARAPATIIEREDAAAHATSSLRSVPLVRVSRTKTIEHRPATVVWNPLLLTALRELYQSDETRLAAQLTKDIPTPSTKTVAIQALEERYSAVLEHILRGAADNQTELIQGTDSLAPRLARALDEPVSASKFYRTHAQNSTGFLADKPFAVDKWLAKRHALPADFSLYKTYEAFVQAYSTLKAEPWLGQRGPFLLAAPEQDLARRYEFFTLGTGPVALLDERMLAALPNGPLFLGLRFPKKDIDAQTDLLTAVTENSRPEYLPKAKGLQEAYRALRRLRPRDKTVREPLGPLFSGVSSHNF